MCCLKHNLLSKITPRYFSYLTVRILSSLKSISSICVLPTDTISIFDAFTLISALSQLITDWMAVLT